MKQLGKNEEKIEYINLNFSNGECYIGQSKNYLRNGRGLQYNKNGEYYFSQSKNCLRNGIGIQYNKNGDIIYEGEFINGKIFYNCNVCKVTINENSDDFCPFCEKSEEYGFGFLRKIPSLDKSKKLPALIIVNYSIIIKNCLKVTNIIINFVDGNRVKLIIDDLRKVHLNYKYDIARIEIKESDNLNINYFLDIEEEIFYNKLSNKFLFERIFILNFSSLNKIESIEGFIEKSSSFDDYIFYWKCFRKFNNLGFILINPNNNKVIGINLAFLKTVNKNIGLNIKNVFEDINESQYLPKYGQNNYIRIIKEFIADSLKIERIVNESLQKIKEKMSKSGGSYMESIGFFENYRLFNDKIYHCLSILKNIIIPNYNVKMYKILDKINIYCQIK